MILTHRGADRPRHYMIEMQSNGKYVILGEDRVHASLLDLAQYHTQVGIKPFMELLTEPCGQASYTLTHQSCTALLAYSCLVQFRVRELLVECVWNLEELLGILTTIPTIHPIIISRNLNVGKKFQ